MIKRDFDLLGKYIKATDPEMFDHLSDYLNTASVTKIGAYVANLDPEQAESILADAKAGA